jgi:DNA-binding transcriptional ArsR family regulator
MSRSTLTLRVAFHKALANPVRLRILAMLRPGSLCVCQITAVLRLAPSTVSAHLAELRRASLVSERKDGRWVEYRLAEDPATRALLDGVFSDLERDGQLRDDAALLTRLRTVPLERLCRVDLDLAQLGISPLPPRSATRQEKR